jgi:signal transduction histidine kinase
MLDGDSPGPRLVGVGMSLVGLALLAVSVNTTIARSVPGTALLLIETLVPGALALTVVAVGVWLAVRIEDRETAIVLGKWSLVGGAVLGGAGLLTVVYQVSQGVELTRPLQTILNNVTGGVFGGILVGLLRARTREQVSTLDAERDRMADEREKLALLNRIVRHDIRNDINVATGATELLGPHVDDEGQPLLEKLKRALTNATYLTDTAREFVDLLDESGTGLEREPTDLAPILDQQVQAVKNAYPHATVQIDAIPDVTVSASQLLSSVFRNLLTNAIQHSNGDEPTVRVSVEVFEASGLAHVHVDDDGPGIRPERRDAVFGRGDRGLESDGTGVGLYLVDTLVDAFGGDVWIDESPLGGVRVTVELAITDEGVPEPHADGVETGA